MSKPSAPPQMIVDQAALSARKAAMRSKSVPHSILVLRQHEKMPCATGREGEDEWVVGVRMVGCEWVMIVARERDYQRGTKVTPFEWAMPTPIVLLESSA